MELRSGSGRHVYYLAAVAQFACAAATSPAARASVEIAADGAAILLRNPLIGGIALLGGLLTMASAVRVLYPALAIGWNMSAAEIGLLYAALPLGAAIGALTSGKLAHSERPG